MLTELNVTSPTGIRHIERLENRDVGAEVIAAIEATVAQLAAR